MGGRTVILGGGISGLALGFHVARLKAPTHHVVILERQPRWGGWIQTQHVNGSLFELGPHSLRTSGAIDALELCHLLGLHVQWGDTLAHRLFIYTQGTMNKLPKTLRELLWTPTTPVTVALRSALGHLAKTLFWQAWPDTADLSINDYGSRVFGNEFTDTILDALMGGVYAGDLRFLSMRSCLPSLFRNQQGEGHLSWKYIISRVTPSSHSNHPLTASFEKDPTKALDKLMKDAKIRNVWSLKDGLQSMVDTLVQHLAISPMVTLSNQSHVAQLRRDTTTLDHHHHHNKILVVMNDGKTIEANHVISTLDPFDLIPLLSEEEQPLKVMLAQFNEASDVAVVTFSYGDYRQQHNVEEDLKRKLGGRGFGYLVPSKEQSLFLGVLFDSWVFPQQDQKDEFRLSVMLRGSKISSTSPSQLEQMALEGLREHLNLHITPQTAIATYHERCIPQYGVFHHQKILELDMVMRQSPLLNKLIFCSRSMGDGIGVPHCISRAKRLARKLWFDGFLDTKPYSLRPAAVITGLT
jgi:oxygen-dependent protoporphyrinogen oxidase